MLNPTNPNRPMKKQKSIIKLKVKWTKNKMAHARLEPPWPFTSQAGMLNRWASRPIGEQSTKSTNKPYPVVKNIYYIMDNKSHLGKNLALSHT